MTEQELLDALQLKTLHLIRPSSSGQQLDPRADPAVVPYYFNNIYSFEGNQWLTGLTRDGILQSFPGAEPSRPILILVLGTSLTGRTSFINLLLWKINLRNKAAPFVVTVDLPSRDKITCAREVAKQFILGVIAERRLDADAAKPLWDMFEREADRPGSADAPFASLFNSLRALVGPMGGPVVFVLRGGDDDKVWTCCLNSTRQLADYLIAETGDEYNARSANRTLKGTQRVALVVTRELGLAASLQYLEYRLSHGRAGEVPGVELAPFMREAVQALFEANDDDRKPIASRSIGWLADTLDRALLRFAERLRPQSRAAVPSPAVITRDFMLAIRNELNKRGQDEDV